jgi:myo-inositol 2-dehydrogenase/D-chiro-inositol 1-dehydrogenase
MRIGVIGAGRIGRVHATNFAGLPGVEVVLADLDGGRASVLADEIGASYRPTVETLLAAELDGIVVAAATDAHASLIVAAADAGLPTLCEKPISLSLARTDEVVRHVARAGTVLDVGFQRRHDPAFVEARRRVTEGRIGNVYVVRFAGHDAVPPPASYIPVSGGIFLDLHLHDFDIVRWVTGQEVDEVYADGSVLVDDAFAAHDDVDTTAVVMRLCGGTLAVITGGRQDGLGYDHRMEMIGSADSISIGLSPRTPLHPVDASGGPVGVSPAEPWQGFADRFADAYRAEAAHFVRVVAGEAEPRCSCEDARRSMVVALAAERSRHEHRPVRIAEVDGREPMVAA